MGRRDERHILTPGIGMLFTLAILCLGGCASNEPTISGFGIGDSRTFSVGETFEIRLPVADSGVRLWRITSYDSYFVTIADNMRAEIDSKGSEIVIPVLARQAGETDIEITQRIPAQARIAGQQPKVKRFRIQIVP